MICGDPTHFYIYTNCRPNSTSFGRVTKGQDIDQSGEGFAIGNFPPGASDTWSGAVTLPGFSSFGVAVLVVTWQIYMIRSFYPHRPMAGAHYGGDDIS